MVIRRRRERTPSQAARPSSEYYYATLNAVFQRPQVGVIPGIAASSCVFCQRNEQSVKDLVAGGGKYSSPPLALKNLAPLEGAPKGQLYYQATSAQLGAWVVDEGGKKVYPRTRCRRWR